MNKILGLEIISEMMDSEEFVTEGRIENADSESIMEMFEDIDELDSHIGYTEEMVPVIQNGEDYLVEHENIIKVMIHYNENGIVMDEEDALLRICSENNIDIADTYIIIESEEAYRRNVFNLSEKIKKEKDPKKKQQLKMRLNSIKTRFNKLKNTKRLQLLKKKNVSKKK